MSIEPCDLSFDAIREYAQRVGEHHAAWDDRGKADVGALIAKLGGTTVKHGSGPGILVTEPGKFQISVMVPASEQRRHFKMAHALGHYFLHYRYLGRDDIRIFECGGEASAEVQANVFASTLLMPTPHFTAAHAEHDGDEWKLADQFDVSPRAVEVRAQVLGLDGAEHGGKPRTNDRNRIQS